MCVCVCAHVCAARLPNSCFTKAHHEAEAAAAPDCIMQTHFPSNNHTQSSCPTPSEDAAAALERALLSYTSHRDENATLILRAQ